MTDIRLARLTDLDVLSSLERTVFAADAWSPRSLEEELDAADEGRRALVAVADTQVVGYAALSCNDDTGDLLRVAVAPDHRKQGIASRLCAAVLDAAARQGCTRVLLEVAASNSPALALYGRLGFAEIDRRRRYYAGSIDAVVMQLDLAAAAAAADRTSPWTFSARSKGDSRPLEGRFAPARQRGEQA